MIMPQSQWSATRFPSARPLGPVADGGQGMQRRGAKLRAAP